MNRDVFSINAIYVLILEQNQVFISHIHDATTEFKTFKEIFLCEDYHRDCL